MTICISHDFIFALSCFLGLVSAIMGLTAGETENFYVVVALSGAGLALLLYKIVGAPTWHPLAHWRIILQFLALASFTAVSALPDQTSSGLRVGLSVVLQLTSLLTLLLFWLFPTPKRTFSDSEHGPYRVGTMSFDLDPSACSALLPEDPSVAAQVWFPLSSSFRHLRRHRRSTLWTSGNPATQAAEAKKLLVCVAHNASMPSFLLQHLGLATGRAVYLDSSTNSAKGLPVPPELCGESAFPLIVFSHGKFGWRNMEDELCVLLASHGYVVCSVDHSPDAMLARSHARENRARPTSVQQEQLIGRGDVPANFDWSGGGDGERDFYVDGTERRLRQIEAMLEVLQGRGSAAVDTSRIIAIGHSYGGGTVASLACRNENVKRVVVLDGWMWPVPDDCYLWDSPVAQEHDEFVTTSAALLFISASDWVYGPFQRPFRKRIVSGGGPGSCSIELDGTDHQNFASTFKFTNAKLLTKPGMMGKGASPRQVARIVTSLLTAFVACDQKDLEGKFKLEASAGKADAEALVNALLDRSLFRVSPALRLTATRLATPAAVGIMKAFDDAKAKFTQSATLI